MPRPGVTFHGLDAFEDELRLLTSTMVDEAGAILTEAAFTAKAEVAAAYPFKSGALQAGLQVRPSRGIVISGAELVQTAPHGSMYERGTKDRETAAGANRGRMKATPTLIPIASRHRDTAIAEIKARLLQHGAARVSGEAA